MYDTQSRAHRYRTLSRGKRGQSSLCGVVVFSYMQKSQSGSLAGRERVLHDRLVQTALLAMLGAVLALLIGPAVAEPAGPLRVEVTAKRYAFQPAEITVHKGHPVDLVLKSGDVAHGLRIGELNLDIKVNKGATTNVNFTPDKVGNFVGHCSVFCGSGHGQMTLTIHVVD
jgi:cytochrome c oxidase subunit II